MVAADAITGATYSSKALHSMQQVALRYIAVAHRAMSIAAAGRPTTEPSTINTTITLSVTHGVVVAITTIMLFIPFSPIVRQFQG